jgi:hypothetical protein
MQTGLFWLRIVTSGGSCECIIELLVSINGGEILDRLLKNPVS